ncbi:MAG: pyruvate formate lyase-activating protein [Ruminococcus sp.]|nr:pyruvate formate lyase-activating protein [Ruminococcus sp.]
MLGYIHSTESFGTVDGPGIRFVVFFQGCPMRCLYCHNPDTWEINKSNPRTVESILDEYDSYKEFLKNGGITCTGGEPLLQIDFVTELFEKAKQKGIHTCLDTSGITFEPENTDILQKFERLITSTDLVMLDIKHIDDTEHKKLTGHSNKNILMFAEFLRDNAVPLWIRHVVVPGITDKEEYLHKIGMFLGTLNNLKALDVLPYHTMGKAKYNELGINYPLDNTPPADKELANWAKDVIMSGIKDRLKHK